MLLGLLSDDDILLPFLFIFFSLLKDSGRVSFVAGLFMLYFYFFLFSRPFCNILVMFYIAWECCHKNSVLYFISRNAKTVVQLMMDIIGLFTSLFLSCSTNSYSFSIQISSQLTTISYFCQDQCLIRDNPWTCIPSTIMVYLYYSSYRSRYFIRS